METINNKSLSNDTEKLLKRYMAAAANLYGMIPLHELLKIYNSQNEPVSEKLFLGFIDKLDFSKEHYAVLGEDEIFEDVPKPLPMNKYLLAEYLYALGDFDDFCELKEEQGGKSYYIPDKEQFLKYEDEYYFEKTPEFISLRAFLRSQPNLTREDADEIAIDLRLSLSVDGDEPESLLQQAKLQGLKIKDKQMHNEFGRLCCDFINNTRMHIHRGHTPAEVL